MTTTKSCWRSRRMLRRRWPAPCTMACSPVCGCDACHSAYHLAYHLACHLACHLASNLACHPCCLYNCNCPHLPWAVLCPCIVCTAGTAGRLPFNRINFITLQLDHTATLACCNRPESTSCLYQMFRSKLVSDLQVRHWRRFPSSFPSDTPFALRQAIAKIVSDHMGGAFDRERQAEVQRQWAASSAEVRRQKGNPMVPAAELRAGLGVHRALLFKFLADASNVPCCLIGRSQCRGALLSHTPMPVSYLSHIDQWRAAVQALGGRQQCVEPPDRPRPAQR